MELLIAVDGVDVWRARLDQPGWPGSESLPAGERERASAFMEPRAARHWVASRWALRQILGRYLQQDPAAVEIDFGERGKPQLLDRAGELEFNLSHSGDLTLVAVAHGRAVGIDIERIDPNRDFLALAERALSAGDVEAIRSAPPAARAAVFYAAWVRHEARLKCQGDETAHLTVANLDAGPNYAAALAITA